MPCASQAVGIKNQFVFGLEKEALHGNYQYVGFRSPR